MNAFDELNRAWAEIQAEEDREQARIRRHHALKILATIPNGTPDADLTDEQRRAWREFEEGSCA